MEFLNTTKILKYLKSSCRKTSGEKIAELSPRQFFDMLQYNIVGIHKKKIVVEKVPRSIQISNVSW